MREHTVRFSTAQEILDNSTVFLHADSISIIYTTHHGEYSDDAERRIQIASLIDEAMNDLATDLADLRALANGLRDYAKKIDDEVARYDI